MLPDTWRRAPFYCIYHQWEASLDKVSGFMQISAASSLQWNRHIDINTTKVVFFSFYQAEEQKNERSVSADSHLFGQSCWSIRIFVECVVFECGIFCVMKRGNTKIWVANSLQETHTHNYIIKRPDRKEQNSCRDSYWLLSEPFTLLC